MSNVIDLNEYRFKKLKKEVSPELTLILDTLMGRHLYAWVYLSVRSPESVSDTVIDSFGFGAWLSQLMEALNLTREMTLLFAFEVFTEAVFKKAVNEVKTSEIDAWLTKGEEP